MGLTLVDLVCPAVNFNEFSPSEVKKALKKKPDEEHILQVYKASEGSSKFSTDLLYIKRESTILIYFHLRVQNDQVLKVLCLLFIWFTFFTFLFYFFGGGGIERSDFRWFKFTLVPPYSIAIGKLRLAIWDTSF